MLGFDVMRADWCDALLDRAFRRGLVLLPAGERSAAFLSALRHRAVRDRRGPVDPAPGDRGPRSADAWPRKPPRRWRFASARWPSRSTRSRSWISRPPSFETHKLQILAVEQERYGALAQYPPDVLRAGRRPLLQFPLETLEATAANPRAIGIALRDRVSGRFVGYALGSALENHDEEGVASDPRFGENNTFYLQAMATLPTVQNSVELENHLLESLRERAIAAGFEFLSTLIEDRLRDTGPAWFRSAAVLLRIDNYLGSGICFAYFQAALKRTAEPIPSGSSSP